jgi:hypothetical protein
VTGNSYFYLDYDTFYLPALRDYGINFKYHMLDKFYAEFIENYFGVVNKEVMERAMGFYTSKFTSKLLDFKKEPENGTINEESPEEAKEYLKKKWRLEEEFVKIIDKLEVYESEEKIYYFRKSGRSDEEEGWARGEVSEGGGVIYMVYDKPNKVINIDYKLIWSHLQTKYMIDPNNQLEILEELVYEHFNVFDVRVNPWADLRFFEREDYRTNEQTMNYNELLTEVYTLPQLVSVKLQMYNKEGIGIGEIYSNDESTLTIIDREYPELDSYKVETGHLSGKENVKEILYDNGRYYDEHSRDDIVDEEISEG